MSLRFCSIALALLFGFFLVAPAHSQGGAQSGDLNIDLSEEDERDSYSETQDGTIHAFKELANGAALLAQGGSASAASLDDNELSYLAGVYLYCAVNSGTCPLVLEAILEVDTINSRLAGKAECPNMKRFWNAWVKADMEERHKFLVKTSFINAYTQFNSQTRPKFLKCEETIAKAIDGHQSNESFFRSRYQKGAPQEKLFPTMVALLTQLKQKVPNVFIATGSQQAGDDRDAAKSKKQSASGGTVRRSVKR